MDVYELSDKRILKEWGAHMRGLRLRKNMTQKSLAEATRLSLNVIKALESGHTKLSSLVAVLRALENLDSLRSLIFQPMISPLQMAKMQGKKRQRASGGHLKQEKQPEEKSEW